MSSAEVVEFVKTYFAYHRSNNPNIKKFRTINYVKVMSGGRVKAHGVYFNYDPDLYEGKGKYIYSAELSIKNPFITEDQVKSALITDKVKEYLDKHGHDSVVLIMHGRIREVVVLNNSQIKVHDIFTDEIPS